MQAYVTRKPIYDRYLNIVACELLYQAPESMSGVSSDGSDAGQSEAMINAFVEEGVDKITGGMPAYINVSREYLLLGQFPKECQDLLVPELSNDMEVNVELVDGVKNLLAQGFKIALDNFAFGQENQQLIDLASVIKLDIKEMGEDAIKTQVSILKSSSAKLLVANIETNEEFEYYKSLEVDYFQGFFPEKPKTLATKEIPTSSLAVLGLVEALNIEGIETKDVEDVISRDARLALKLLQIVNSPLYAFPKKLDSIHRAIIILGLTELKSWASVLAMTSLDNTPSCLLYNTMVRAKMCQELAFQSGVDQFNNYFTLGLLSLMDAIIDMPFEAIFADISIADEITQAIIQRKGHMGAVLNSVIAYEKADWDNCKLEGLDQETISNAYLASVQWADTLKLSMN